MCVCMYIFLDSSVYICIYIYIQIYTHVSFDCLLSTHCGKNLASTAVSQNSLWELLVWTRPLGKHLKDTYAPTYVSHLRKGSAAESVKIEREREIYICLPVWGPLTWISTGYIILLSLDGKTFRMGVSTFILRLLALFTPLLAPQETARLATSQIGSHCFQRKSWRTWRPMKRCALATNWPCLPYGIGSDPVLSKQAAILPTTPPQSRATITIYVLHPYIRSSGLLIKILYCTRMTPRAQAHTHTDVLYSYIYMYMYPPPPEACWDKTYIYIYI